MTQSWKVRWNTGKQRTNQHKGKGHCVSETQWMSWRNRLIIFHSVLNRIHNKNLHVISLFFGLFLEMLKKKKEASLKQMLAYSWANLYFLQVINESNFTGIHDVLANCQEALLFVLCKRLKRWFETQNLSPEVLTAYRKHATREELLLTWTPRQLITRLKWVCTKRRVQLNAGNDIFLRCSFTQRGIFV